MRPKGRVTERRAAPEPADMSQAELGSHVDLFHVRMVDGADAVWLDELGRSHAGPHNHPENRSEHLGGKTVDWSERVRVPSDSPQEDS